jgi:hypothetical protein
MSDFQHLTHLGIDTSVMPTHLSLPKAFNQDAHHLWVDAYNSDLVQRGIEEKVKSPALWQKLVRQFLSRCEEADTFPYTGRADVNDSSKAALQAARKSLVDFFHSMGIFERIKIRSVERTVRFTSDSFVLEAVAYLREIEDPTFQEWMRRQPNPGFQSGQGCIRRPLGKGTTVEFCEDRKRGPRLTYRIQGISPIRLSDPRYSRNKLQNHVLDSMWKPLIEAYPIRSIHHSY